MSASWDEIVFFEALVVSAVTATGSFADASTGVRAVGHSSYLLDGTM